MTTADFIRELGSGKVQVRAHPQQGTVNQAYALRLSDP
jgi:hypothetical protein